MIGTIACVPFADQRPGTSGLRRPVARFREPHYLAAYLQAVFDAAGWKGKSLALGGDGRFFSPAAIDIALCVAAGNGAKNFLVGRGGYLSTPAMSAVIRRHHLAGGILLTASHNPGGEGGDFGVKIDIAGGGPAPDSLNAAIATAAEKIDAYRWESAGAIDIDRIGSQRLGDMRVEIIDPLADHLALLEEIFDFDRLRAQCRNEFRFLCDTLNGIAGPMAEAIFRDRLGLPASALRRTRPLPDFGGSAPDPDRVANTMASADCDLAAIIDGDGDRCALWGQGFAVGSGDALAIMAEAATRWPYYRDGLQGIARSLATSRAIDRVADALGLRRYETPVGWKFFAPLLEAGLIRLCGEESHGAGSDHVREKDGIWAALFWLDLVSGSGKSVRRILHDHWLRFGRDYALRRDFADLPPVLADSLYQRLAERIAAGNHRCFGGRDVIGAEDFRYVDPVSGAISADQGLRFDLAGEARILLRRSGTGTAGVTLRLYAERYVPPSGPIDLAPEEALGDLIAAAAADIGLTRIRAEQEAS